MRRFSLYISKILLLSLGLLVMLGIFAPSGAQAHSQLIDSNPKPDEQLTKSPQVISLTFNGTIKSNDDSIKLFDSQGKQISNKATTKAKSSSHIELELDPLEPSIYVVNWSVVSPDSHPISGTFTFTVGNPVKEKSTVDTSIFKDIVLMSNKDIHSTQANLNRWILFSSTALSISISFLILLGIIKIPKNNMIKVSLIPILIAIFSSLASIFIQNAIIDNKSIIESISYSSFVDQIQYDFGIAATIRIIALIALFATQFNTLLYRFLSPIISLLIIATITFSGHSAYGQLSTLAIISSLIHLGATSIWFGGLGYSLVSIRLEELSFDYKKFSKLALALVLMTIFTGVFASWRQVGNINYAINSAFGRTLGYKIVLVMAVIVIAFFARRFLKNNDMTTTRKLIAVESILLLGVFALTSILVSQIPSKTSAQIPVSKKAISDSGIIEILVDPAKSGPTQLHVYVYDKKGLPLQIESKSLTNPPIQVTIQNNSKNIKPVNVAMRFQGLNHFSSVGFNVPFSGDWKLVVRIQVNDFDQLKDQFEVKFL